MERAHYSPPWADTSIIGIAGSSGSGKSTLANKIVSSLALPWVAVLSMDSFYKVLTPEQHVLANGNQYDFDSPSSIDFDILVERLKDLKAGRRAEIPIYSFEHHRRQDKTVSLYSPHVLILEGIFILYDQRILDLLDLRIFAEADADVCLGRRITRDVRERGRDIEGCIKQWMSFVKPNFEKYVEPQRKVAVPARLDNRVAIDIVVGHVKRTLKEKSRKHQEELERLGKQAEDEPLSENVLLLEQTREIVGMNTVIQNPMTAGVDFIFYFDRLSSLLVERALENLLFNPKEVSTPQGYLYQGLEMAGEVSAVVISRGGSCFDAGLRRVIPDCKSGRLLIQTNYRTGEPELHYWKLPPDIASHDRVLLLDPQMSSGGAALMAVKVLVDHGVSEEKVVFVTYFAGRMGVKRLLSVFPNMKLVVCKIMEDSQDRWIEEKYFGC
ncbi:Uridine kinase [Imshaugia aleurites]|uniref:uridine/cytidine kinase n=1 Tax=Imshaugia aleurites TaxID=172621 RepID=A0A8H3IFI7_9LECA|nr:Uridine kinase [Imshaugia aleurites]